ncbi:HEXXH motif domain-containing protein [Nocardia sp. NPDC051990]|uniref:HEXXH motif domain-containing protein n=1 Tax=Nocardia sp. NPDC051990 TaxID=3155285 RepID=UPI00341ECB52
MSTTVTGIDDAAIALSSGYGTETALATLVSGMLTTRMILLRTLVAEATARPEVSDGAGLHAAYQALAELQRTHPAETADLLAYPHLGPWLAHVLGRIYADDDSSTPLWADCGYLGWLAAAGGIACLPDGSMRVVVRNGIVMLPGIGMARLGPADFCGHCELSWTSDGSIGFTQSGTSVLVPSQDYEADPDWLPLRKVRGEAGERTTFLDDLDPFRDLAKDQPVPPRLTAGQVELWQRDFADAWALLRRDFERYLIPMRSCLRIVAPLTARPRAASTSHTSFNGVGCVYTTAPADSCQLALTMIHEIQHTKFNLLIDQILLFDQDPSCRFYAPWRDDPRPIMGLAHGIYAFFGVTDFWRVHRSAECHGSMQSHVEFALWRVQVAGAIEQAMGSGLLTATGEHLMRTLRDGIADWAVEELPDAAGLAASEISVAHHTFWQVRNLLPAAADIAELAARWRARAARPEALAPSSPVDQDSIPDSHRRLHLSVQLKEIDSVAAAALSIEDQPVGDKAYLAQDFPLAAALYLEQLRSDPLRPQLWAGLALTLPKLNPDIDFRILSVRAEVVARLYQALRSESDAVEVVELIDWLSGING